MDKLIWELDLINKRMVAKPNENITYMIEYNGLSHSVIKGVIAESVLTTTLIGFRTSQKEVMKMAELDYLQAIQEIPNSCEACELKSYFTGMFSL